jgi:hypothetical protein
MPFGTLAPKPTEFQRRPASHPSGLRTRSEGKDQDAAGPILSEALEQSGVEPCRVSPSPDAAQSGRVRLSCSNQNASPSSLFRSSCWVPLKHHVVLRSRHRALERDRSPLSVSWLIPAGRPLSGGEGRHHEADSLGGPSRAESVAFRRRPLVRRMKNSLVSLCHTSSLEQ